MIVDMECLLMDLITDDSLENSGVGLDFGQY